MSSPSAAELSLINGSEFLEELDDFAPRETAFVDSAAPDSADDEFFGALEQGLPMRAGEVAPVDYRDDDDEVAPAAVGKQVPVLAAALVILACLTAGAVTAAVVFHDRVTQITAPRQASR